MRKNLLIALAVFTGLVISLTSCLLEDIETVEQDALKANFGLTAVNIADIQGVTALADNTPVKNIDSEQYTGTVKWSPENETFKMNTKYTATITLTPKSNYTFKSVKANFFKVGGAESAANSKNSGVITAVFPPAKYGINIAAIEGITALPGDYPKTVITGNAQYSGTVTWSPEGYFEKDVKYTATITLTPKPDYTLQGVAANFFTVAGAESVTNKANSGVITAVVTAGFPSASSTWLTEGVWADGNISTNGEQWFKFTATSSTQYIHASFGTLNSSTGIKVEVSNDSMRFSTSLRNGDNNAYTTLPSLSGGRTYYIKVSYAGSSGTYQITFNQSRTPPPLPIPSNIIATATTLTAGVWADGTISANGEQWFKFTATSSTHYIHASFGTLSSSSGIYVQVYSSTGSTIGNQTGLYSYSSNKYTQLSLTIGQTYYIKVTSPYGSNSISTYQIAFNTSNTPPSTSITLTADTWANGSVSANGEQWFKFIATASVQYIHVNFAPLNSSTGIYVQLYDSTVVNAIGSQTRLNSSNTSTPLSVTSGQVYYIKVTPSLSGNSNAFWITFSASSIEPSSKFNLTAGVWADGNISANGEQWFKFSATAYTQYIHVAFGTNTSELNIQVYDSNGYTVGSQTTLYSWNSYTSMSVTSGQTYYIKVTTPYGSSSNSIGTYQIAFNTSYTPPLPGNSATATELTADTWGNGNITSSSGEQWFKFTATSSNTHYIHASFGTLNGMYVQLYDSTGSSSGSQSLNSSNKYTSLWVTSGQTYYIKVSASGGNGTYQIAFNTTFTPPGTPTLTANTWVDGNITSSSGEQWFKFTATEYTHYIHVSFGTLNDLYVQVYSSTGITIGSQINMYGSTKYTSLSVTSGQTYYLKVTPFGSNTGNYKVAINTSSTPPSP